VKALSQRDFPPFDGANECRRYVRAVNVVHCFHSEVRQKKLSARYDVSKHLWIEVSSRIHWIPARSNQVSVMQDCRRKCARDGLLKKIRFNAQFANSVISKRLLSLVFCGWDLCAGAMNLNRPAMDKALHASTEGIDGRKRRHILPQRVGGRDTIRCVWFRRLQPLSFPAFYLMRWWKPFIEPYFS
jgi:hypothetical protein